MNCRYPDLKVGDAVMAIVDGPESNTVIRYGDYGIVAHVNSASILVDWDVEPDPSCFHNGNSQQVRLAQDTGWWIYGAGQIRRVEDEVFVAPNQEEFDMIFS